MADPSASLARRRRGFARPDGASADGKRVSRGRRQLSLLRLLLVPYSVLADDFPCQRIRAVRVSSLNRLLMLRVRALSGSWAFATTADVQIAWLKEYPQCCF